MRVHPSAGDKMEPQVMGRAATTSAGNVQGSSESQLESGPGQLSSVQCLRRGQGQRVIPSCPALVSDLKKFVIFVTCCWPIDSKGRFTEGTGSPGTEHLTHHPSHRTASKYVCRIKGT